MSRRAEIIRLIREEFDPTPSSWEGREWYDNAEDVADKIESLFASEECTQVPAGAFWGPRVGPPTDKPVSGVDD